MTSTAKAIEVDLSLPAARVVRTLNQIIEWCGKPMGIRVDNSPEKVSAALQTWAAKRGIGGITPAMKLKLAA